ncbi:MerR family transcriptional regulator [Microlunatus sp. Y2014]|uniref:MerR family transcriptional regulator n=1 Tax=Microlunatus sp. Y2014 TaxID=3418488 RepID=UPI003DA6F9F7
MLTISQLATYASVTVRTIRHYHQIGLLAEPERDHSGYRRYDSFDLIRVVRIRTLAAAGVPLARIGPVLEAEPEDFDATVDEVDAQLRGRIRRLQEYRRRLRQLRHGERLVLSEEACDMLDLMREIGLSETLVGLQRDACVLLETIRTGSSALWVEWQQRAMADPDYVALFLDMDALMDADPDDPRVLAFVDRTTAYAQRTVETLRQEHPDWVDDAGDPLAARLLNDHGAELSPAWLRINELTEERLAALGYAGPV